MRVSVQRSDIFQRLPFCPDPSSRVDRWFQLPMGWDTSFVSWLIEKCGPIRPRYLIDPFCGAGASLVSAARHGYSAIGIDSDCLAVTATYAKTHFAQADDLNKGFELLAKKAIELEHDKDSISMLELVQRLESLSLPTRAIMAITVARASALSPFSATCLIQNVAVVKQDVQPWFDRTYPSAEVIRSNSCNQYLWDIVASVAEGPWLVLASPPHPNSRGGIDRLGKPFENWCRVLACEISCQPSNPYKKAYLPVHRNLAHQPFMCSFLESLTKSAPANTLLMLEYEITSQSGDWTVSLIERAEQFGVCAVCRIILYDKAPDARDNVVEGGILVIKCG